MGPAKGFALPLRLAASAACLSAACEVKVGHWNLYWRALSDPEGRKAIIESLDGAAASGSFDFLSLVEATGQGDGTFPQWLEASTSLKAGAGMAYVNGSSGHETIAMLYAEKKWRVKWSQSGDMGVGRPYLLTLFNSIVQPSDFVWVMNVHPPHWPQTGFYKPGDTLAEAFKNASAATGRTPPSDPFVVLGDFNEFGECSLPPTQCSIRWYRPAYESIKPLWSYLGEGSVADVVPFNTTTCCTKWKEGASDWRHHFDKVYFSTKFLKVSKPAEMLNYTYPGLSRPCDDPACIGDSPSGGKAPTAQGSWHRGWQVTFSSNEEVTAYV